MKTKTLIFLSILFAGSIAFSAAAQIETSSVENSPVSLKYKDFRFSIGGGYAYRLGKTLKTDNAELNDLNSQFRNGYTLDADAQYFFTQEWGVGFNVNYGSSTGSVNNFTYSDGRTYNKVKETQHILFAGPSVVTRSETSNFLFLCSIGIGPLFYLDRANFDGVSVDATKTTFGTNAGLSGEYKLNDKTGIGLKLSYTLGNIKSLNINGQNISTGETMSISNLMLSAFVSFRSW